MRGQLISQAETLFAQTFKTEPDGAWWAPGRVNIIGEHTDYNGGYVLPIALPTGTVAVARRRDDELVRLVSAASAQPQVTSVAINEISRSAGLGWASYAAGVAWAAQADGLEVPGLDIAFVANVPRGAGLSSSASLSCSAAAAWNDIAGWQLSGPHLASLGRRAENEIAGAPTGTMDQFASVLCEAGHALKLNTLTDEITQVPFDLDAAGLALLVVNSHAPHELVDGAYGERRASCEQAADALGITRGHLCSEFDGQDVAALDRTLAPLPSVARKRARHVILDSARVEQVCALLAGGMTHEKAPALGRLLNSSHASMRDDFEITVPAVDSLQEALIEGGAFGARMTGGGFGGCVIALVESGQVESVLEHARQVAAASGFPEPEGFVAVASSGAQTLNKRS